ncbi:MAG: alpha-amylase/4-alpha-glucanotransferase domain-containing protein [Candidatus Helarchaeota archaeon]
MDRSTPLQKTLNFPIVFHFHQPVGNFSHVIESAYQRSYLPLVQTLDNYQKVKAGLHFSGYLLEWLVEHHPEFIDLLGTMCDRKQIEFIGGAYYEPIIAMIPDEDKLGQINLLRDYIKDLFNVEVQGFWLAERVWEPHLPKILEDANLKYILIDDNHLRMNGLSEEETFYTYITEEQGAEVIVVPINEPLRYMTPWKPIKHTLEYLTQHASTEPERIICLIDDAEKFGLWGSTHEICFKTGFDGTPWMDKLFSMIERNPWIKSLTLQEYFELYRPRGLIYMPSTSYDKMARWVLPTPERKGLERLRKLAEGKKLEHWQEILKYLKGTGFWRQFLIKYYEANNMHKKMLYIRQKLRWFESEWGRDELTLKALRMIYKAQANDPYWHGQFGGVYFAFMRANIYNYLIEAEKIIEKAFEQMGRQITPAIVPLDIDKDGRVEILMETSLITMYLDPFRGGTAFEIDHKEKNVNILNTFQRREEAYYSKDVEFTVDRWRRYAFFDHFLKEPVSVEDLLDEQYEDIGNFPEIHYTMETNQVERVISSKLTADGELNVGETTVPLRVSKFFEVLEGKNEIRITFTIQNPEVKPVEICHLTEIPLYLTGDLKSIEFKFDKTQTELLEDESFNAKTIQIYAKQNDVKVKIVFNEACEVLKYNLFTYAKTNGGDDTLYQGTVLAIQNPIQLEAESTFTWRMSLSLE